MRAIVTSTGVLLLVLLFVSDGRAMDAGASANRVMIGCRHAIAEDGQEAVTQGFCLGSISGVWDFAGVCSPHGALLGQAVRIVVQYIDSRPTRLNEPFNALAGEALRATWPCH
jgi:hypothetical protein